MCSPPSLLSGQSETLTATVAALVPGAGIPTGTVTFFVDSASYATFNQSQWPAGGQWVFDHPFFIILNVAVGGTWPGSPDATTQFPQQMLVDYFLFYSKSQ